MIWLLAFPVALAWAVGLPFVGGYIYAGGDAAGFVVAMISTVTSFIYGALKDE